MGSTDLNAACLVMDDWELDRDFSVGPDQTVGLRSGHDTSVPTNQGEEGAMTTAHLAFYRARQPESNGGWAGRGHPGTSISSHFTVTATDMKSDKSED